MLEKIEYFFYVFKSCLSKKTKQKLFFGLKIEKLISVQKINRKNDFLRRN